MALFLGIDLGTSYFKVGLFDDRGGLAGLGRVAVAVDRPAPRRCELPVERFWELLRSALSDALAQTGADKRLIEGVSYASQANTFLLLDRGNEPLTPLVIWTDARAEPLEEELAAWSRTDAFARHTGFRGLSGQWAAAKVRWLQKHEPGLWSRTSAIQTISDYLTFSLTGTSAGDAGTAAFLGLYDLRASDWWPEALRRCGVSRHLLSQPLRPGTTCGTTNRQAAGLLGLPEGIPFAVGGIDHQIAALGAGLDSQADVSLSIGTVLAAIALVEQPQVRPECFHGPHTDAQRFYRLAFDANGAGDLEQYRGEHAPDRKLEELIELAAAGDSSRKEPSVAADGRIDDRRHGAAIRAMLQRIANAHRALLEHVGDGRTVSRVLVTGGGARSAPWMQFEADALAASVVVPESSEGGCLGAAILAAAAAGAHPGIDAAAKAMVRSGRVYEPQAGRGPSSFKLR